MKIGINQYKGKSADYDRFRPKYSEKLIAKLDDKLSDTPNPIGIDIGAGTGIWTRQLAEQIAWKTLFALEPNHELLAHGKQFKPTQEITWLSGHAENIPLDTESVHFASMASTLNWLDIKKALQDTYRILKPSGLLCLTWNPIDKSSNQDLLDTEKYLRYLRPKQQEELESKKTNSKTILIN